LAVALLRHAEATLRLTYSPPELIDQPLFSGSSVALGTQAIDSLDLIEVLVAVEHELGVLLTDRTELVQARTLHGIATLLIARADSQAVERFCDRWSWVGRYEP
jgi:hypothetical protein